jgi:hypothetical protein
MADYVFFPPKNIKSLTFKISGTLIVKMDIVMKKVYQKSILRDALSLKYEPLLYLKYF